MVGDRPRYSSYRGLVFLRGKDGRSLIGRPAIFTWPVLVAELVILGTAAFRLMFAPVAIGESEEACESAVMLWRLFAILNLAMSPLVFMEMASEMAQASWTRVIPIIPQI